MVASKLLGELLTVPGEKEGEKNPNEKGPVLQRDYMAWRN